MRICFAVQTYEWSGEGYLSAQEAIRAINAEHARFLARSLNCAGAIAYSREVSPERVGATIVLLKVGALPEAVAALC